MGSCGSAIDPDLSSVRRSRSWKGTAFTLSGFENWATRSAMNSTSAMAADSSREWMLGGRGTSSAGRADPAGLVIHNLEGVDHGYWAPTLWEGPY